MSDDTRVSMFIDKQMSYELAFNVMNEMHTWESARDAMDRATIFWNPWPETLLDTQIQRGGIILK